MDTPTQDLALRLRTELHLVTDLTPAGELVSVTCADPVSERNPASRAASEQRDVANGGIAFTLHARRNNVVLPVVDIVMLPVAEMVVNLTPLGIRVQHHDGGLGTSAMPLFVARVAKIAGVDAAAIPVTFPDIAPL